MKKGWKKKLAGNPGYRNRLLTMCRKKLGMDGARGSVLAEEIRKRCPSRPEKLVRKYDIIEWFLRAELEGKEINSGPVYRPKFQDSSDEFLKSYQWRKLRMEVIKARGPRCECCGAHPSDGVTVINVDHIQPRKTHPHLALDIMNLQILCSACNHGKGNWDSTDWRHKYALKPRLVKTDIDLEDVTRPMWSKKESAS